MKNILITGSEGQLGNELKLISPQFAGFHCFFTDIPTLDITNNVDLKNFFNSNKVDYIINCAAYTAVDKAETDKFEAEKINVNAVANLIKMASNFQSKLIHISTDYVYDGKADAPYTEKSPTNPQSVYGKTKLNGEIEAQRYINSIIIRTSWLYSSFGGNFVKTMIKLSKEKEEINVVADQIGTPTYAADLALIIFEIIKQIDEKPETFKSGIYNYSNEGVCSWFDFANEIFTLTKSTCKVNPIETADYPTPAKRPSYSVLNKDKIKSTYNITIPEWKDSLIKCIEKIGKENSKESQK